MSNEIEVAAKQDDELKDVEISKDDDLAYDNNDSNDDASYENLSWIGRIMSVIKIYWSLGLIAFGGPQAHVALLREHLVVNKKRIDEDTFTELFAIGQGLPGPTSTQLVVSTALYQGGPLGGLIAFFFWNVPGLIVLLICALLIKTYIDPNNPPWFLVGIPPAAISLVFKAFYGFGLKLDKLGIVLALISCNVAILINGDYYIPKQSSQYVFPSMLIAGALFTLIDSKRAKPFGTLYDKSPNAGWDGTSLQTFKRIGIPIYVGFFILLIWAAVLTLSICLVRLTDNDNVYLEIFEVMFRVGSLIFGGGQVVLPMLEDEVVPKWMTREQFYYGLGITQSLPGPLFNFSAYLGAVYQGVAGGIIAWLGLFGPGVILIFAITPFWARLRHYQWFKAILLGLNATAIGFVGAACVLLWEGAVHTYADAIVFCTALTAAVCFTIQAPFVVIGGGVLGAILSKDAASLGQVPFCLNN